MDRHQVSASFSSAVVVVLVGWYRKSHTDPQLKDLRPLVMSFSPWLVFLRRFFHNRFKSGVSLGPSELCRLSSSLRFSQQPKENTPKRMCCISKLASRFLLVLQTNRPKSPWVWRQRCKPCKKHFRKPMKGEPWLTSWPLVIFDVCRGMKSYPVILHLYRDHNNWAIMYWKQMRGGIGLLEGIFSIYIYTYRERERERPESNLFIPETPKLTSSKWMVNGHLKQWILLMEEVLNVNQWPFSGTSTVRQKKHFPAFLLRSTRKFYVETPCCSIRDVCNLESTGQVARSAKPQTRQDAGTPAKGSKRGKSSKSLNTKWSELPLGFDQLILVENFCSPLMFELCKPNAGCFIPCKSSVHPSTACTICTQRKI